VTTCTWNGYRTVFAGDLADDLPTKRRFRLPDAMTPAGRPPDAERAAAKHVAYSHPRITPELLADVLAGLQRL
jgi:hypothetical protein